MRTFLQTLLLTGLLFLSGQSLFAFDFESEGFYYNILSSEDKMVAVTNKVEYEGSYFGDIVIPSAVEYEGVEYNVTSIGGCAFYNCFDLISLTIPNSVTSIGDSAFYGCNRLSDYYVEWNIPLEIPANVFKNSYHQRATLHVPVGTKALYEAAEVWKYFGTILVKSISVWSLIDLSSDEIYLSHEPLLNLQPYRVDTFALASEFDAAPLSPVIDAYMQMDESINEKTFYLEGGKTYYLDGNQAIYKGLTLATQPEDEMRGLRARVICGIGKNAMYDQGMSGKQWEGPYSMFFFGRSPEAGEGGEIYMKKLAFYDIDFDNPTAFNYGDQNAKIGTVSGNYFINMFSDRMPMTVDNFTIENCTFKRFVRGFIREQGVNYDIWKHVLIKNNQFFDCGYYNNSAGGYAMIAGSGRNVNSNLYSDFKCIENTFYDSPFPAFISEENGINWAAGAWNITFSNNTLVNFNTRASGAIFRMRTLPDGSVYRVENNLIVLCKQEGDQRQLQMFGADIRNTSMLEDGSPGKVSLYFNNNWSTNNDLTNGQIFSSNAWNSTRNNFGMLVKDGYATLNGSLDVAVADVSAEELFVSPCPPHKAESDRDPHMHRADALDGTATTKYNVNLYYKNKTNEIYRYSVGDPRWREQPVDCIEPVSKQPDSQSLIFDLQGRRLSTPTHGIILYNGKKVITRNLH